MLLPVGSETVLLDGGLNGRGDLRESQRILVFFELLHLCDSKVQFADFCKHGGLVSRFRQAQFKGDGLEFHLLFCYLWFISEHGQGVIAVLAQRYLLSVMAHDDGIVIGTDIDNGGLEDPTLRYGRSGLSGHKMLRILAQLNHIDTDADHPEGAYLPLFFTLSGQLGRTVEYRLAGDLTVLGFDIFHVADHFSALVHIEQHRVPLILCDVNPRCQHPASVAVETVISHSYSFSHYSHYVCYRLAAFEPAEKEMRCNITMQSAALQESVQRLHTCMQPLHTFLAFTLGQSNFVVFFRLATLMPAGIEPRKIIIDMTKAELEKKKDLARSLYLSGMEQIEIADKVGVSRQTLSKWGKEGGWKETRAAKTITRPELIKKLLLRASDLLDKVAEDPKLADSLGDQLSKLTAAIDKLDKSQANVVNAIEVFMAFSKWLEFRAKSDPMITPELLKTINKLQDVYLVESFNKGALA